ncbi:MAG: hypothetical protein K2Y27_01375 [Xanthobacteraceae bacterium]|nr:hypothetical protein [Xanthobacteraceae bacterium]
MPGTLLRFIAWYGLPAAGAAIGYAIGDGLGLFIGLCLGGIAGSGWLLLRRKGELRAIYQKAKGLRKDEDAPDRRLGPASRALLWSFVAGSPALLLYSSVIALAHDSLAGWMSTLQPAADWLAQFIPAFGQISANLVKTGHADRVMATQHVLLVGWLYLTAMTFWIVSDMMVINRRDWARIGSIATRSVGPVNSTWAGCICLAVLLPFIFFSLIPPPPTGSVTAIFRLPVIALFFVLAVFIVWCLSISWAARRFRALAREEGRQHQQLHQEMQRALRDVFSGKSHER